MREGATPPQQMTTETLQTLVEAHDITTLTFAELLALFERDAQIAQHRTAGRYAIDPRTEDRILFNPARARRPHDNRPPTHPDNAPPRCVVCEGHTTGIIDVAPLTEGFTFINKNLFPVLSPQHTPAGNRASPHAEGLHLLQWTSSIHAADWHTLPLIDRRAVFDRLAALEHYLIEGGKIHFTPSKHNPTGTPVFVSIIKNYGRLVGGSLAHGHQQIILSTSAPRRIIDNWRFHQRHGETFSSYVRRHTPEPLQIQDYGPVVLVVPYFMRRPGDLFLIVKNTARAYLHALEGAERDAICQGWRDAIRVMRAMLLARGREPAYNVITHNGPGAGLYFEFLPYTQETGGLEHLGLWVCQNTPEQVAEEVRGILASERQGAA
ncbi:MAG: hypothetical protein JXB35_00645 [Anaerolineae bacterium]|nr:hypothetical protein [Anaerolineae bacterium]